MKRNSPSRTNYFLNSQNQFVIENYNATPVFSNFFPGIAGLWGIPMWAFYVNRGQCITSFGIEGKDKAILEFHPANIAYRTTALQGFRTFLKIKFGVKTICYEPFGNHASTSGFETKRSMAVTSHDLTIEEKNLTLGLVARINYFTLPEEPFAALVRRVTIENTSQKKYTIELVDGLPMMVCFGYNEWLLKHMSRTAEAWNQVTNFERKAPYYNLKVAISDKPHVTHITAGNFYFAFHADGRKVELLEPIVEPARIFGESTDFSAAENFFSPSPFKFSKKQTANNKTPSAMGYLHFTLAPKSKKETVSLFGHAHNVKELDNIVARSTVEGYVARKARRNQEIIEEIKNLALTSSALREFNLYCTQTFLDNVLRGGLPISLETSEGKAALSVFTRKHGDPERDYNHFIITPTYLSQGNGNYRDVNQNRRNDAWFNPDVKDCNVVNFLNLIQPDGYNPLIIRGMTFVISDPKKIDGLIKDCFDADDTQEIREVLEKGFLPGKLLQVALQKDFKLKIPPQAFLKKVLSNCRKHESAEHGEGFWTDHWTYNLDLIESYLALYPEEKRGLILERKTFDFHQSLYHVLPRDQRYILTPEGCRQFHSVVDGASQAKGVKRDNKLRTQGGNGPVYQTTLIVKLLCLIANKAATLDPSGIGVEMEADRPNWYDALNGLPGLLGSSISETYEVKRFSQFLLKSFEELGLKDEVEIKIFEELHTFILNLSDALISEGDALAYWVKSNNIKEYYRHRILTGIDGQEKGMQLGALRKFLKAVIEKTDRAFEAAKNKEGLIATYFTHEITQYEKLDKHCHDGFPFVRPLAFKRHNLPLFLEGFVHALRIERKPDEARRIYEGVRRSPLFDKKLKMYKVNTDLSGESQEIGRARVFPAGWLENESVWLHMEYKFLLELLRCGLHKEFYANFKDTFVPFLNPKIYGRSILENSSFIVSSAHADASLHGRGFVARLSGTTAELLHIWFLMNLGERPFSVDKEGKLTLTFRPVLEGRLFTKAENTVNFLNAYKQWQKITLPKNTYAFNLLGSTLVVYHNPKRLDTFGARKVEVEEISLTYADNRKVPISSNIIPSPYAGDVRSGKITRIDIVLK